MEIIKGAHLKAADNGGGKSGIVGGAQHGGVHEQKAHHTAEQVGTKKSDVVEELEFHHLLEFAEQK